MIFQIQNSSLFESVTPPINCQVEIVIAAMKIAVVVLAVMVCILTTRTFAYQAPKWKCKGPEIARGITIAKCATEARQHGIGEGCCVTNKRNKKHVNEARWCPARDGYIIPAEIADTPCPFCYTECVDSNEYVADSNEHDEM